MMKGVLVLKSIAIAVLVLFFTGCVSTAQLQRFSAGRVGCEPNDIEISNVEAGVFGSDYSWVAVCKEARFQCSSAPARGETSCTEMR